MHFRVRRKSVRYSPESGGKATITLWPNPDSPWEGQHSNGLDGSGGTARRYKGAGMSGSSNGGHRSPNRRSTIELLHGHPLLAPMVTISGVALGNTSFVETPLLADPVHASLSCALVGEDSRQWEDTVDRLTLPLRREQDRRLAALGNQSAKEIRARIRSIERERESFFAGAVVRDPAAVATFEERIREFTKLLRPALVVENLRPGLLERAAARGGGSHLAAYNESLFSELTRARPDFELLLRSWQGKTPQTRLLQENATVSSVRPLIGGLFRLGHAVLARLACSSDPLFREFFDRLIVVAFPSAQLAVPDCWSELVSGLLSACSHQRGLRLTSAAHARLAGYRTEVAGQGRRNRHGPALAVKNAVILHFWAGDPAREVSGQTMELGIVKAKEFIGHSITTVNACVAAEPRELNEEERQLLIKLEVHGPLSDRDLQRKYKSISKEKLQERLRAMIEKGRICRRADGLLDVVRPTSGV